MLVRYQMKAATNLLAFVAIACGLLATFFIEVTLIRGRGEIGSIIVKSLYNAIFFLCPILLVANLAKPIFESSVILKPATGRLVWALLFCDLALFQSVAYFGLGNDPEFRSIYMKRILLLQATNLLFFWACACALMGQGRFHPFVRDVVRNPFGAIGYWLGHGATQVSRAKKTRGKR